MRLNTLRDIARKPLVYSRIYLAAITCGISEATTYRIPLMLMILVEFLSSICALSSVYILFNHLEMIGPWSKDHFLFFTCFALVIDQLHLALFADGFWVFSEMIKLRTLDYVLIRPVSSIFSAIFTHIRPFMFIGLLLPVPLLIYYGSVLDITVISWLSLPVLLILALGLLVGIEIILMCANFWSVDGHGLNYCRLQLQTIVRWPDFIYQGVTRKILTFVVPLLVVANSPIAILTDGLSVSTVFPLILAVGGVWSVVLLLWRLSLKAYE